MTEFGGRPSNYTYDELYRLTREAVTGDPAAKNGTVDYTFDAVGNRLSRHLDSQRCTFRKLELRRE